MKPAKLIVAAALAGTCAIAQQNQTAVSAAAANPSTIHAAVADLGGTTISAFAAEVIDAIATIPKAPVSKVLSLVDASQKFLAESDETNLADVIVALISNVPFDALPEWTNAMIKPVNEATSAIEEVAYNKLVADVVTKIGGLDESDDDKTVITAFAIKLLSRGKDTFDEEPVYSALAAVPATYSEQLKETLASVFGGNYEAVLPGVDIIAIPANTGDTSTPGEPTSLATETGIEGTFETSDDGDSIPLKGAEGSGSTTPTKPKPPVPPKYPEQ